MKRNKNLPIGILDSGVGGLTAVTKMKELLPNESIIYLGDSLRMPYGNRSTEEIITFANQMIEYLEAKRVKAILLACNTISSNIARLRSGTPLFSIVEAGVRAIQKSIRDEKSVGIIATCATVKSGMYERNLKEVIPGLHVVSRASTSLPRIIDSQLEDKEELMKSIEECIDPIVREDNSIRHLLLGCSHFPIIKKEIDELFPYLKFIDPAREQVLMLEEYLKKENLLNTEGKSTLTVYTTAETYEYAAAIKRLKLEIDTLMKIKLV